MKEYKEMSEDTETKKKKPKKGKKKTGNELTENLVMILFVLMSVYVLKNHVLLNAEIPSGSMEKTIMTGDRIFGSRLSYRSSDPERGEVIIFKFPDDEEELYIKRVIGIPGDSIEIIDGRVYLNGSEEPLEEPYLPEKPRGDFGIFEVPENCYFVMGDNRNYSSDSRAWEHTYVKRKEILAKAVLRYYPFKSIGKIR